MHADRLGRAGRVGRTEVTRTAQRHYARQRGLFHEAADIGDGECVRQESKMRSLRFRGQGRACYWLDPVANDPSGSGPGERPHLI